MKLRYGKNVRFELWGGSAVRLGKTGTTLLRRSARLLALVQDMGSIPIRRYSEEAVNVGLCQWGWEKAQLALMRLGVAAGDRTFVETVNQSLIITL